MFRKMVLSGFLAAAVLVASHAAATPSEPDVQDWPTDGGGGGSCMYCITSGPYGNCYTASYSSDAQYSNCRGSQYCWRDNNMVVHCSAICEGTRCFWV